MLASRLYLEQLRNDVCLSSMMLVPPQLQLLPPLPPLQSRHHHLPRPQHLPGPRVYAREPRLLPRGRLRRRFLRQELHDDPVQHLCLRRWVWFDLHRLSVQSIRQEELRVRTLRDRRVRLHRLHVHRELQVRLQHKQLRQRLWGCSMGHIPGLWNSGERASKRPIPFQPAPI